MRFFPQKFLPSSCSGCRNCCHGVHSSSALKLEDKQVSPYRCPLPEVTNEKSSTTLNENVKDDFDENRRWQDIHKKGKLASATSFPTNVLQAEEGENLNIRRDDDDVGVGKEGTSRGSSTVVVVPKSILKKPSFLPGASSSPGSIPSPPNNKTVKWMPDEQLVHVREIEDRSVYEEDENRRCLCMIL